jgi:hypothetical protein
MRQTAGEGVHSLSVGCSRELVGFSAAALLRQAAAACSGRIGVVEAVSACANRKYRDGGERQGVAHAPPASARTVLSSYRADDFWWIAQYRTNVLPVQVPRVLNDTGMWHRKTSRHSFCRMVVFRMNEGMEERRAGTRLTHSLLQRRAPPSVQATPRPCTCAARLCVVVGPRV